MNTPQTRTCVERRGLGLPSGLLDAMGRVPSGGVGLLGVVLHRAKFAYGGLEAASLSLTGRRS